MMKGLKKHWKILLGVAGVLMVLVWLVWWRRRRPIPVTTPPPPGKIAFVSGEKGGSSVIRIMESSGSDQVPLTEEFDKAFDPTWSPDGRYIAFLNMTRQEHQNVEWDSSELWVMDADGSNKVRLVKDLDVLRPVWSPDGTHIVFKSDGSSDSFMVDNSEIYVVDREGSNLANLSNHPGDDGSPEWSPDGARIAFVSDRDGNLEIYAVDRDGSNLVNLTNHSAKDMSPEWAPDGTRIAFASDRDGWGVYIMSSNGTGVTRLARGRAPAWSPDGSHIAHIAETFTDVLCLTDVASSSQAQVYPRIGRRMRGGYWSPDSQRFALWEGYFPPAIIEILSPRFFVYVVNSDGSGKWKLAEDVKGLSWSPDGQYIIFSRVTDSTDYIGRKTTEIFISSADGGYQAQLTTNRWDDDEPAWQPQVP